MRVRCHPVIINPSISRKAYRFSDEVYKASKSSSNSDVKTNGRKSQVEDDEDDVEAGPELPPEEADDIPDDEDGRFFGGGVNKNTVQVLDYIDGQEEESTVRLL